MNIDTKVIAARPLDTTANQSFSDVVMKKIENRKRAGRIAAFARRSPVAAVVLLLVGLILISGTAYAISYLWPQLAPTISTSSTSSSGRTLVIADNCSKEGGSERYELKKGAPIAAEKLTEVVKAKCELTTVSEWAEQTYPMPDQPHVDNVNKPGLVIKHTTITPAMLAVQIVAVNDTSLTIRDSGSLLERKIPYDKSTKTIVSGQYSTLDQLSAGDVITYIDKTVTTTKNRANCTNAECYGDIVSDTTETLVIVKLSQPFDAFRAISYLVESTRCAGNPVDDCPATSSMDVFMGDPSAHGFGPDNNQYAQITGKIQSYTDSVIILETSSGRTVRLSTPWNLIDESNNGNTPNKIVIGDTLQVDYFQATTGKNDTTIEWGRILRIGLLIEAMSKGGPYNNY